MKETIQIGKELGRKHFASIAGKSQRWKRRNVPIWIREELFVPFYLTENDGMTELFIIHPPVRTGSKVHYILYARAELDEEECTEVRFSEK